jgi:hypothetical protein
MRGYTFTMFWGIAQKIPNSLLLHSHQGIVERGTGRLLRRLTKT